MYDRNRFFDTADQQIIAWAGYLSQSELEKYLAESCDVSPDGPQSEFAHDLGRWYDHDCIYAQASDRSTSLAHLAAQNFITDSRLVDQLEKHGGGHFYKCFIILWNAKRVDDSDREFAHGKLAYIGSWISDSPFDT